MNRLITKSLALIALVGAVTLFSTSKAEAAFVAWICDDAACSGAGDLSVADESGGDGLLGTQGAILFNFATGGYEVVVNISQSVPALSAGMDINYTVTNILGPASTVWLYAVDTDFPGPATLNGTLGGTADGGSVTAIICGGDDNTQVAPNDGPCTFGTDNLAPDTDIELSHFASGNPYALAIGVSVTGLAEGQTATGDFRVVPEPVSLSLFGLGLAALAVRRRRKA